ncbi:replication initiator protein, partial [Streptococcus mitis]|nr:replication initiator protein [Streptococcus mitis]
EVQQSSSEKGRLANKIYLGELSSTPVASSNRPSVKKRLGQVENETAPVSYSAPSETEVSETESLFIEDEEDRNTQPILKRKVEKVTKYDRDYIWGLVQDQFRREGFSETASEIAMTDFERIYQYALDNVRFVRRAEVLAEFVFNGLYSVWNNRVRKGGG